MNGQSYTAEDIERVLGRRLRDRAENKRRGGDSAGIGYRYEISVTVALLMDAAAKTDASAAHVHFHDQPLGFADDLLVVRKDVKDFYQIKSERSAPTLERRQVVVRDLCRQVKLMRLLEQHARVFLIVGDHEVAKDYKKAARTEKFRVGIFPRSPLPQTAADNRMVVAAVRGLMGRSVFAASLVEPSVIYHICRAFKSALDASGRSGSVTEITDIAAAACHWIFGSGGLRPTDEQLKILNSVDDTRMAVLGRCLLLENMRDGRRSLLVFRDQEHWAGFVGSLSRARRRLTLKMLHYAKARIDEL